MKFIVQVTGLIGLLPICRWFSTCCVRGEHFLKDSCLLVVLELQKPHSTAAWSLMLWQDCSPKVRLQSTTTKHVKKKNISTSQFNGNFFLLPCGSIRFLYVGSYSAIGMMLVTLKGEIEWSRCEVPWKRNLCDIIPLFEHYFKNFIAGVSKFTPKWDLFFISFLV